MTDAKKSIRPVIKNIGTSENKSAEEDFQNTILRPIIKMQHELLIAVFNHYVQKRKVDFNSLNSLKKNELISNVFRTDTSFKTEVRGLIIGHFTVSEYALYESMASDMNKRILTMIKERLLSVFV